MNIKLKRVAKKPTYTIGKLYINGEYFCDTIEDKDRGLDKSMSIEDIKKKKVYAETAIPTGTYEVTTNIVSPKYSKKPTYMKMCGGRVPRILDVPGFDGVLIHTGNTQKDSMGCIIIGMNKVVGKVVNSIETFKKLFPIIDAACKKEKVTLTIE